VIRAVVTDIEGTTSSLSFVHDVLFPYARDHLAEFLERHRGEPSVRRELDEVRRLAGEDLGDEALVAELVRWIDEDRKTTPLKTLQGMIWESGFREGRFQGHVYEDAVRHLRQWHARGIRLYVFSSGSVQAQKLLFGHTAHGDLTPLFSGYFDTAVGPKREPESYRTIAHTIGQPLSEILFLSDVPEELDAAREAGMPTVQLARPEDYPQAAGQTTSRHPVARSFDDIRL
jgi:enolase-phosphatase E1